MKYLITGAAGFIGFHLSKRLLGQGNSVVGIDNLNEYYDVNLKKARLNELNEDPEFTFHRLDLVDRKEIEKLFSEDENTDIPPVPPAEAFQPADELNQDEPDDLPF